MFLYEFAEKTAQKPDTVATYVRRNKKIFKNHVERRQKQIWLDEKAVDILLKKYPEVQKKQKKPLNKERFEEIITKSLKTLYENQEILAKEIDEIRALVEELEESFDHKQAEQQKEDNGLISLEKLFGEDTQVDRLIRQVREQGEKIELLQREISVLQNEKFLFCRTRKSHFSDSKDVSTCENNKRHVGDSHKLRKHEGLRLFLVTFFHKKASNLFVRQTTNRACWDTPKP